LRAVAPASTLLLHVPARRSVLDTVTAWSTASAPAAIIAQNVGVGLVYAGLMELVLLPQLVGGLRTTPVWPANGFALAAVWLLGGRVLPGIALSAAIVMAQQVPLPVALVGSLAPVGQVLLGTWVLRTGRFDARLERARDPLILTLIAAPSGAAVSSTVGTLASWVFGALPAGGGEAFWLSWFMRAWLGIATTAPLVFAPLRARAVPLTGSRLAEAATIVVGLIVTSLIVVGIWTGRSPDAPFSFLALPFVLWAGLRFGARGASIVVALLTVLAILLAVVRLGPVADLPVRTAQISTFLFLLLAAIAGQVLAAMSAERDDALKKRVQLEELLRHSQKMESVGRLAGGIAHDFNNLLTAILGYTDIVVHGMDPKDPRRADAEQIERAAMRAADLTRQMLSFSRREAQPASVLDLNRLLGKVEPMLRRVIGEDVKLTVVSKATRPFVRADAGQMEQVILNLAVNARDAMPQGGRLLVETADAMVDADTAAENHEARLGSHVMLSVTDTGVGMPASVRSRLFEPYFTTKPAGKGTGLGLSTVYGIVRQSDGHITVTSEVGSGTTFRVMLPLAAAEPAKEKDSSVQKLPGGTEHILLIEDDASVRRLAKDLLVRLGYSTTEAASGRAGIALGSDDTRHFDLLVCDVILGDMSGPSAAEALRALRPAMRVLYVSGYTDDAIVRTGVLEEGKAFLPKPFTPLQLARKVREVLEDREAGAA
jgi:signal transduction histidine kinase/ActR/RegA family two-component response regulator